jgi:hypothetical protein
MSSLANYGVSSIAIFTTFLNLYKPLHIVNRVFDFFITVIIDFETAEQGFGAISNTRPHSGRDFKRPFREVLALMS